ncbi:hypothetical protein VaNZ11_010782 [Volvox africanus]|uniref:Uncharacterized protein n=1 Tax=Volvox africanus TaxID=51714 RepID=A0ABQ5SA38_9CHLO|nr:hypothetical protein VaNZ11_010782 [Volvox africanus]
MSGLCKGCCAPTAQAVRRMVEQQEPAQTMSVPCDESNPISFQAPEIMASPESLVSQAVFFHGTGSSSILSSSLSSSSLPSSSLSIVMDDVDAYRFEKLPVVAEALGAVSVILVSVMCESQLQQWRKLDMGLPMQLWARINAQ